MDTTTPATEMRIDLEEEEIRAMYMLALLGAATMSMDLKMARLMMEAIEEGQITPSVAAKALRKVKLIFSLPDNVMISGMELLRENKA